eukprot:g15316.t1
MQAGQAGCLKKFGLALWLATFAFQSLCDILSGKVLGLLFGSNSPICYGFVRGLAKIYKAVKKEASDPFEVVYVSADTSRREQLTKLNEIDSLAMSCHTFGSLHTN